MIMKRTLFLGVIGLLSIGFCAIALTGCDTQQGTGRKARDAKKLPTIDEMRINTQSMTRADLDKWLGNPDSTQDLDGSTIFFYEKAVKDPETGALKNVKIKLRDEIVQSVEFP